MPIDINESTRSWSFLLFKDFVAHHGDELLKTLLPEVIIKKQYVFTDKIDDFEKAFLEILPNKTTNKTILWRLESSNEDGTGHHFVLKITGNKILILDPAEATVPLYSAEQEKVQIQTIAKKYDYKISVADIPYPCQPYVPEGDYVDTSCQTWSIALSVSSIHDPKMSQFKFKSSKTTLSFLRRLKVLKKTIETIVKFLPKGKGSKIRSSTSSADFLALKKSIQQIYTDDFILENMKDILKDEHIHELVRDEVFAPVEKLK